MGGSAPSVFGVEVDQLTSANCHVNGVGRKALLYDFFDSAWLGAELLESGDVGHVDHHATRSHAKPTATSVAAKMSLRVWFISIVLKRLKGMGLAPRGISLVRLGDQV